MLNAKDAKKMNIMFPARHVARALGRRIFRVNIHGMGDIEFRLNGSDANVLRQVFVKRDYDISAFPQFNDVMSFYRAILDRGMVPVFIDAGANIGAASVWFARMFPEATVIAVEPDAENAELCRRNAKISKRIIVVEAALGAAPGRVEIANASSQSWSFQTKRADTGTISLVTVPELVASVPNGIGFAAKIDIEGFESDLFAENTGWVDDLGLLILEPHDWLMAGAKTSRTFQKVVAAGDFDLLISGENLVYIRCPPAPETVALHVA